MSNTIHVSASANAATGNGSSSNPYASIQSAIDAAQAGDTILVGKGTYYENLKIKDNSLNIVSASGPDQTTIQAASSASVVYYEGAINGGTLNGFSIAGGAGYRGGFNQYGGGIDVANIPAGSAMDIKNCIVRDNNSRSTTFGGGLHIGGGDLKFILTSPSGMSSVVESRENDDGASLANWPFLSVRHWGESSTGKWKLRAIDTYSGDTGILQSASLLIRGARMPK